MVQPDLNYMAPEVQLQREKYVTSESDMFSLGLLVCALHSGGRGLIQAQHNPAIYARQIDQVGLGSWLEFQGVLGVLNPAHRLTSEPLSIAVL